MKKLVRTFQWNRGDRTLKVIDEFQLKKPGTFSAALVGFSPFVNLKENYGENDSLQFQIETNVPGLTVSAQEIPERSQSGKKIPWRLEYGSSVAVLQGKYQVKIALKQL